MFLEDRRVATTTFPAFPFIHNPDSLLLSGKLYKLRAGIEVVILSSTAAQAVRFNAYSPLACGLNCLSLSIEKGFRLLGRGLWMLDCCGGWLKPLSFGRFIISQHSTDGLSLDGFEKPGSLVPFYPAIQQGLAVYKSDHYHCG